MVSEPKQIGRRTFLHNGSLVLSATMAMPRLSAAEVDPSVLRVGLVTDLHYADKPSKGSRYYRQSLDKLATAAAELKQRRPDFIVELGDLVDAADSVQAELGYLERINQEFSAICPTRHYVLG